MSQVTRQSSDKSVSRNAEQRHVTGVVVDVVSIQLIVDEGKELPLK